MAFMNLLGPLAVLSGQGATPISLGRKAQALLVFLACQGAGGVSRSRLTALLWGDHADDAARNSLRQCLHQTRRALGVHGSWLVAEPERVVFDATGIEVDLHQFERLAACTERRALLSAAALYRGDLAQGLSSGVEFDLWLDSERERLRGAAFRVLERLVSQTLGPDDSEIPLRLARQLLADDPLHEGCYRALMLVYERVGLRAKAIKVWEDCRHALRVEVNAEPGPLTRAVYEGLLGSADRSAASNNASPPMLAAVVACTPVQTAPDGTTPSGATPLDLVLHGWQLVTQGTAETNREARRAFEQAVACAPDYPEGLALIGWTHLFDCIYGWGEHPSHSLACAQQIAERARRNHPQHPSPRMLWGKVLLWQMRHGEALDELQAGLAGAPLSAYAHYHAAEACMWLGQFDEALRLARRAAHLDPNDHGLFSTVEGMALLGQGDLTEARSVLEGATARNPGFCVAHGALCTTLVELGDLPSAHRAAQQARFHNRRMSVAYAQDTMPFAIARQRARFVDAWRRVGMPESEPVQLLKTCAKAVSA